MANSHETELELELEEELQGLGEFEHHPEHAHEYEWEHHPEHAHEYEWEHHPEHAHEYEWEHQEHAHEYEWEHDPEHAHEYEWEHHPEHAHEFEPEWEGEFEGGEHFVNGLTRRIKGFVQRVTPQLRTIIARAAPIVGTAIGGPFGSALGRVAGSALGEEELQHEFEHLEHAHEYEWEHHPEHAHEFEWEGEAHHESSQEAAYEIAHHEMTHHEALAEMIAASASREQHEAQAEAMVGAAVVTTLSPRDRRALRRIIPDLIRGLSVLTGILRRDRNTRVAVRTMPTIVRRTVATLKRQASAGQPVTRRAAARAAVTQMLRLVGNPAACAAAIRQNVRATRAMRQHPAAG